MSEVQGKYGHPCYKLRLQDNKDAEQVGVVNIWWACTAEAGSSGLGTLQGRGHSQVL